MVAIDSIRLLVDDRVLQQRIARLRNDFATKKAKFLWDPIAGRMASIYGRMWSSNWPQFSLKASYRAWKVQHGLPDRTLVMTGDLKNKMTSHPKEPGSNESALFIGASSVNAIRVGAGGPDDDPHIHAPFNYPSQHLKQGFTNVPTPYSYRSLGPRTIPQRFWLWRDEWTPDIEDEAVKFATRMARRIWGAENVTQR